MGLQGESTMEATMKEEIKACAPLDFWNKIKSE
jgi:hypothetical protein